MKYVMMIAALMLSVNAQAMFTPATITRLEVSKWTPLYAGQTKLDGIDVVAILESTTQQTMQPEIVTALPLAGLQQQSYRLTFIAVNQPNLKVSYQMVVARGPNSSPEQKTFVSADIDANILFSIKGVSGHTMNVDYLRKLNDGQNEEGSFEIIPMVRTL